MQGMYLLQCPHQQLPLRRLPSPPRLAGRERWKWLCWPCLRLRCCCLLYESVNLVRWFPHCRAVKSSGAGDTPRIISYHFYALCCEYSLNLQMLPLAAERARVAAETGVPGERVRQDQRHGRVDVPGWLFCRWHGVILPLSGRASWAGVANNKCS